MKTIEKATKADLDKMQEIFSCARAYMRESGNPTQWGTSRPPLFLIERDLSRGVSYLVFEDGELCGTFSYTLGDEPTYKKIDGKWLDDAPYGTIHRIASNGKSKGLFAFCLQFCETFGVDIRIDTHENNRTMLHLLEKNGFVRCGNITIDDGTTRIAFQKKIEHKEKKM